MTLRVCPCVGCPAHSGSCPTLTVGGRCPDCARTADQARGTAHARGYDLRWQRTAARQLRQYPRCQCDEHLQAPYVQRPIAAVVDHIDGLGPLGPRGHDPANLRSMTKRCHDKRTARDQPGGWAAR